jgi:hypothetical protein
MKAYVLDEINAENIKKHHPVLKGKHITVYHGADFLG